MKTTKYDQQYKLLDQLIIRLQSLHFASESSMNWTDRFIKDLKELSSLPKDEFQQKYSATLKSIDYFQRATLKAIVNIMKFNNRKLEGIFK